jgi:hypothetical protein
MKKFYAEGASGTLTGEVKRMGEQKCGWGESGKSKQKQGR